MNIIKYSVYLYPNRSLTGSYHALGNGGPCNCMYEWGAFEQYIGPVEEPELATEDIDHLDMNFDGDCFLVVL